MKLFSFLSILLCFISQSVHAAPQQTEPQNPLFLFVMVGIFILFLYFTAWRPQSKRAKEHQDLLNALCKGDEVATAGGLLGRISKLNDQFAELTLTDNVHVIIQKPSITSLLPKGTIKSFRS